MTWKPGEFCSLCGNTGEVVINTEGMRGPCPECDGLSAKLRLLRSPCGTFRNRHALPSSDVAEADEAYGRKIAECRVTLLAFAVSGAGLLASSVLLFPPLHDRQIFLWGVLAGSPGQLLIVLASRWAWDRVQWLRWFCR